MPRFMVIQFNIGTKNCSVLSQYGIARISFDLHQSLIRVSGTWTLSGQLSFRYYVQMSLSNEYLLLALVSDSSDLLGCPCDVLTIFWWNTRETLYQMFRLFFYHSIVSVVEPKSFFSRPLLLLSCIVCFHGLDPKSFVSSVMMRCLMRLSNMMRVMRLMRLMTCVNQKPN